MAEVNGIGFLTGADIRVRFVPTAEDCGITFLRTDCPAEEIPALVEWTVPRERRTSLARNGVAIEMIEHVMAALAGLRIDNCRVEVHGPELPGCDGSCLPFAEALLDAGIVRQGREKSRLDLTRTLRVEKPEQRQHIVTEPGRASGLTITYELDYGSRSPIRAQTVTLSVLPETFVQEVAFARTFVLEAEVQFLKAQGYGSRITYKDLLVYGAAGPIDNTERSPDECARHKLLDCVGDFALLGHDIDGHILAHRSGHQLNAAMVRQLRRYEVIPTAPLRIAG